MRKAPGHDGSPRGSGDNFTLVELLVVVAVIVILLSLLLPALGMARETARSGVCMSNQRQCGLALQSYANDFDDWMLTGSCLEGGPQYRTLGSMMIGLDYTNVKHNNYNIYTTTWDVASNNVFSCPSLRPPSSYTDMGMTYPSSTGYTDNSGHSFGLRYMDINRYYPGERVSDFYTVKGSSLYMPSQLPFMVDTIKSTADLVNFEQWSCWYLDIGPTSGALHLRHNGHSNVWCPDGHGTKWSASDTATFKNPWRGTPTWTMVYCSTTVSQ